MIKDTLYVGQDVRDRLMKGIKRCSEAIGGTMGTGGKNGLIETIEHPNHLMTNDGISILSAIHFEDPIEEMGRKILLEAVSRSNKSSGDGSSTTCVLTASILEEGMKHLEEVSPMELKKSLEDCLPIIEESINNQKREVTVDTIGQVASISAEDEKIGALIQEIYQKIGPEGIINWDISKTAEDSFTIGNGITVEGATYYSPYMCDASESGQNTNQIRIKNPTILITKQKITSAIDFNGIAPLLNNKGVKDLIVFCDEVEPLVVPDLIKTRAVQGFRIVLVKMPTLWKDWWYEDLAKASDATVLDATVGLALKDAQLSHLGKFGNISITKENTYIDGIEDLTEYIKSLKEEGSDDSLLRVSRLNTKTARLFIGALSDSALSYKRLKVEDALGASYNALKGGIVAGGGKALMNASRKLTEENIGHKILRKSLKSPMSQIIMNTGQAISEVQVILASLDGEEGFDSRTKRHVNMFDAGIVDPAPIVLNACKNAISVAASILTANVLVLLPREEQESNNSQTLIR